MDREGNREKSCRRCHSLMDLAPNCCIVRCTSEYFVQPESLGLVSMTKVVNLCVSTGAVSDSVRTDSKLVQSCLLYRLYLAAQQL